MGLLVEETHAVGSYGLCDSVQALYLKPGLYTVIILQAALCIKVGASRSKHPSIGMQQGEHGQTLQGTDQLAQQ